MTGKLLHLMGHIVAHYVFLFTCRTNIINVHDLLLNGLNPSLSLEQANVSIFLITYQAFTINLNRSHEIEDCKQQKMQFNINLVPKEGSN